MDRDLIAVIRWFAGFPGDWNPQTFNDVAQYVEKIMGTETESAFLELRFQHIGSAGI